MYRKLAILALAGGVALTGCSKKHVNATAAAQPAKQPPKISNPTPATVDTAWALKLTSKCADGTAPSACTAGYGFTVSSDGTYALGPSPDGKVRKGHVSPAELKSISDLLPLSQGGMTASLFDASLSAAETCTGRDQSTTDDQIVLVRHDKTQSLIKVGATSICFNGLQPDGAEKLHKSVADLAAHYYVTPFPDECLDTAAQVEAMYDPLVSCNTDADCAYVDNEYQPLGKDEIAFVYADDCSVLPALTVANRAAVSAASDNLVQARENLRNVCGENIARNDCQYVTGFQNTDGAPVCDAGVCKVNPSITIGQ